MCVHWLSCAPATSWMAGSSHGLGGSGSLHIPPPRQLWGLQRGGTPAWPAGQRPCSTAAAGPLGRGARRDQLGSGQCLVSERVGLVLWAVGCSKSGPGQPVYARGLGGKDVQRTSGPGRSQGGSQQVGQGRCGWCATAVQNREGPGAGLRVTGACRRLRELTCRFQQQGLPRGRVPRRGGGQQGLGCMSPPPLGTTGVPLIGVLAPGSAQARP